MDEAPSSLALSPSPSISRARSLPRSLPPPLPPPLSYTLSISALPILVHISPSLSPLAISSLLLVCFPRSVAAISPFFFLPLFSFVFIPPLFALQMLGELSAI